MLSTGFHTPTAVTAVTSPISQRCSGAILSTFELGKVLGAGPSSSESSGTMASIIQPVATPGESQDVGASGQSTPRTDNGSETSTNTATNSNVGSVVARIESMLESILVSFPGRDELAIHFLSRRSARRDSSENRVEQIRFPGRTVPEARKFGMESRMLIQPQLIAFSSGAPHSTVGP